MSGANERKQGIRDDVLREALRKSFEEDLKAPPSRRLQDLMTELRNREKARKAPDVD